jgi:thymidine kinase
MRGHGGVTSPAGRLEVITGSMFSGKTERLIARLRAARTEGWRVGAIKHEIDNRYDPNVLITHTEDRYPAVRVGSAAEIVAAAGDWEVVGIDEGHFWGLSLVDAVSGLVAGGRRVIVVAIEFDAWGRPFPPTPQLSESADEVLHLYAPCRVCGKPARFSQRMVPVHSSVMVGGAEAYEPRCKRCFVPLDGIPPEPD